MMQDLKMQENGVEEFGFLEEWENVFFGFLPLGRRIKTCDQFWKGAGIKPEILEFGFFLLADSKTSKIQLPRDSRTTIPNAGVSLKRLLHSIQLEFGNHFTDR